jgi:hypothetical protein
MAAHFRGQRRVSRHRKTAALIETAAEILSQYHPMTVRQVYYQLVSRQVIENSRSAYQSVSKALVAARREGLIPWAYIEDRLRRPRCAPMWSGLPDFAVTAAGWYRRNVWESQSVRIEVWLEKDALSGIFEDELDGYGVTQMSVVVSMAGTRSTTPPAGSETETPSSISETSIPAARTWSDRCGSGSTIRARARRSSSAR